MINQRSKGMTLIEVIIFTVLLSLLITNFINYLFFINVTNFKLIDDVGDVTSTSTVQSQKGFIATTAVILLAMGTLAFILTVLETVTSYADMVKHREIRVQKSLNEKACAETLTILSAKDYFLDEEVYLSDFGCTVHKL